MSDREPLSNLAVVHKGCLPEGAEAYRKLPSEWFSGKFVKKSFAGKDKDGKSSSERMWVFVTSVVDGVLVGRLSNDPVYRVPHQDAGSRSLRKGDAVRVEVSEVIDVMD